MRKKIAFYHSLKFKTSLLASLIFFAIVSLLLVKSFIDQRAMIRMQEEHLNEIAVSTIERRFKVSYQILETGIVQILANPAVVEAFSTRDREALSEMVTPSYEKLKSAGVTQFHFHLPDNTSFFRVHAPDEYGDDLSQYRNMVVKINDDPEHRMLQGLEEGVHGLSLRYLVPIFHEDQYRGSVELGMALDERILGIFQNVSGGEWYLYSLDEKNEQLILGTRETMRLNCEKPVDYLQQLKAGKLVEVVEPPYIIQMIPLEDYNGAFRFYLKRAFDNSELIGLQHQALYESLYYGVGVSLLGSLLLWLAMRYQLAPLTYLEQKVRRLEEGTLEEPIVTHAKDEIGYLAGAMEKMRCSLRNREERLKDFGYRDPLTGAYNRHFLYEEMARLDRSEEYPISLIVADIDDLKVINDREGHAAGDAHILRCVNLMSSVLREDDVLYRVGGDEFVLLLPGTSGEIGEKILARLEERTGTAGRETGPSDLSISYGLATCVNRCASLESVMARADEQMYERKAQKKSRWKGSGRPLQSET